MRAAALIIAAALIGAGTADAAPKRDAFVPRFTAFLDRLQADPSAPPAFALVVVHKGRVVMERVKGARDQRTGAPLTLDTPIYTASVTKSPVGLLAAQLDAKGLLPLGTTLAEVWPGLRLATGQDPAWITARSFLSHVSGVEAPAIQWRYSDTGEYATADVPALLPRFATRANRAYDYGNIGPVLYTAIAETRLKRSWRELLREHVIKPLGLTRTSATLEDFAPSEVAYCNARVRGAWRPVPHKPTALLEAGGGLYSSPRDAATYLRAFTSDGASTGGAIPAAVLRKTYEQASQQNREILGFRRTGYGLGWDLADYDGHKVVSRSGGSAGCR
ncbi:MAG TPA: serine hydrolase domain-containing protein, partial [Salinarimonas sp.]|nr:serine hydrolase domain-containing protein [Salinarimonas sp.]